MNDNSDQLKHQGPAAESEHCGPAAESESAACSTKYERFLFSSFTQELCLHVCTVYWEEVSANCIWLCISVKTIKKGKSLPH